MSRGIADATRTGQASGSMPPLLPDRADHLRFDFDFAAMAISCATKPKPPLEVLDLLDEASEGGSNWLQQWRRGESNPRPEVILRRLLHA